jgi:hypothetical protein
MQLTHSFEAALPAPLRGRYRLLEVRNAAVILGAVAPAALEHLTEVLTGFELTPSHLLNPGGSKSDLAREIDEAFRVRGWRETHLRLSVEYTLTQQPWRASQGALRRSGPVRSSLSSPGETHKVDNFKDRVAIEVEWNAKDGNLDRDLAAFRALHDAGVIDAAVIITRHHASVKHAANFLARRLGRVNHGRNGAVIERFNTTTTTNMEKLEWRLARGDAGGCPVLAVGISAETYTAGRHWSPAPGEAVIAQPPLPTLDAAEERALESEAVLAEVSEDEE